MNKYSKKNIWKLHLKIKLEFSQMLLQSILAFVIEYFCIFLSSCCIVYIHTLDFIYWYRFEQKTKLNLKSLNDLVSFWSKLTSTASIIALARKEIIYPKSTNEDISEFLWISLFVVSKENNKIIYTRNSSD